ncbi:hypothetical protein ACV229_32755 [Burkholderia sp. MR1-5-21]
MIRSFLAQGDRAGSAVITEGLGIVTCSNPPPAVQNATLGMKTYCKACKQEGFIAPKGPCWPGTDPNGKQWALSRDINVCGCNLPLVLHVERNMRMIFTAEEAAALTGQSVPRSAAAGRVEHDEQFVLRDADTGRPLARVQYRIRTASGKVFGGVTDATGHTQRVTTTSAEDLQLHTFHDHV